MRRSIFLAFLLLGEVLQAQTAPPVEELVDCARERAPAIAAARAGLEAAREMEKPAVALPDPMVEAMIQNADLPKYTIGEMDMSMAGVEVRQGLPYPGKRRARGDAAAAETSVQSARIAAVEARIASAVRILYARIYAIDRERSFLAAAGELLDMLAATAGSRYASGGAEQEAMIKAQLEVSRLGERIDDLAAARAARVAELNRWLGTPGAPIAEIAELPVVQNPESGSLVSADIEVARAQVALAERRLAVARLDLKPDFAPAAGIASRGSLGPVLTLRFGVELPFRKESRQKPMIRAAEQELEMARQELLDAELMASSEAASLSADLERADRQVIRFREAIVPQSSVALDAARSSYLASRGDFSTVVEDFGLWLEARVQLARREADRYAAWAGLQRLRSPS